VPCLQNQDHYAVLGLVHMRYKATQKQIKAAREYRVFCSPSFGLNAIKSNVCILLFGSFI